ncbi:probable tubulin polyglutamylase ttll-15 [Leptopilina heterotoma]|uniref:probable tubulin polyglutamylase ttll-15 n=1 Tax=Leptopilina heterotoma TaxID=63436 RepID=UPI001CA92B70|nr:probable tubulin polyglutamylase ttll-15 [Leptopilina heterotoma]
MAKENNIQAKSTSKRKCSSTNEQIINTTTNKLFRTILYVFLAPIILSGVYFLVHNYHNYFCEPHVQEIFLEEERPTFRIHTKFPNSDIGYLKHVFLVLDRLGFQQQETSNWDLLWAHDYPFSALRANLTNLKPHQRVNHFPGCGYITNKVDLSTTEGKFIPVSFKMPDNREDLLAHIEKNPEKTYVQKSNDHRGIEMKKIDELNLTAEGSFVQEFIDKPFLVDGYKFDIGIYTVITSIDPLRIYGYKGDVLFRFCPIEYYPFDPKIIDKYVVGDDYLPIWNVPSLRNYYKNLGFSMKDSFDAYLRAKGKDPQKMWDSAFDAIREIALKKEMKIREATKRFGDGRNFFELMRFDFTLDEDLNVFIMEANMSPNLSSAHFPPNQLLYEQVLFNLFALIGVARRTRSDTLQIKEKAEIEMEVADKNLVVLPEICNNCNDCFRIECQICRKCYTDDWRRVLSQSFLEHHNKMDYRRIFPPPITENMVLKDYSLKNQLLIRWYQGKCEIDPTWCN